MHSPKGPTPRSPSSWSSRTGVSRVLPGEQWTRVQYRTGPAGNSLEFQAFQDGSQIFAA